MGCACNRKNVKCAVPPTQNADRSTDLSISKGEKKKNFKISIAECELTTETGHSMSTALCKKLSYQYDSKDISGLRKADHRILCNILNFAFSNQAVKNFIRAKRKSKESNNSLSTKSQVKDFYQISISCRKLSQIALMIIKPAPFNTANNHTIVASKIFSFIGIEEESNASYKKGRSLSPRSLLYTTNKLPELRLFKNYEIIKDIAADEMDQEHQFVRRISKFKSFG